MHQKGKDGISSVTTACCRAGPSSPPFPPAQGRNDGGSRKLGMFTALCCHSAMVKLRQPSWPTTSFERNFGPRLVLWCTCLSAHFGGGRQRGGAGEGVRRRRSSIASTHLFPQLRRAKITSIHGWAAHHKRQPLWRLLCGIQKQ